MIIYIITSAVAIAALALDDIRLRLRERRARRERAAAVQVALTNEVIVDGVTLPRPDDVRWIQKEEKVKVFEEGAHIATRNVYMLGIGTIELDHEYVWVSGGMPLRGRHIRNYCSAVWKAYRSRVARKAINATK